MDLFYDERDDAVHEARGSQILYWLDDLNAKPLSVAGSNDQGFVFAGARPLDDYRQLVGRLPLLRDRPEERAPLLRLDTVLDALNVAGIEITTPKTWKLPLDSESPKDISYPLFVRTAQSSFKVGGHISRVKNRAELEAEAAELRRALGWDAVILARKWHDLAEAGTGIYGPLPQEIRVWIVDKRPIAWSFHYLDVLNSPKGFPPSGADLHSLYKLAEKAGTAFNSRCVVADFAKETSGGWLFIEAGLGSCAATAHEAVFKTIAARLRGEVRPTTSNNVGGIFEETERS